MLRAVSPSFPGKDRGPFGPDGALSPVVLPGPVSRHAPGGTRMSSVPPPRHRQPHLSRWPRWATATCVGSALAAAVYVGGTVAAWLVAGAFVPDQLNTIVVVGLALGLVLPWLAARVDGPGAALALRVEALERLVAPATTQPSTVDDGPGNVVALPSRAFELGREVERRRWIDSPR